MSPTIVKSSLLALLAVGLTAALYAQPEVEWERTYGGGRQDFFYGLTQTRDGGYVLVGETDSFGPPHAGDGWAIRVNSDGDSLWARRYGGDGYDNLGAVLETEDGDLMLAGVTPVYNYPFWLIKCDSSGEPIWSQTYGEDYGTNVKALFQTVDGGFLLAGQSDRGFVAVRTDDEGEQAWYKTYSNDADSYHLFSAIATSDGGYLLCGRASFYLEYMGYLVKIDEDGDEEWSLTEGIEGQRLEFNSAVEVDDGSFVVCESRALYLVSRDGEVTGTRNFWDNVEPEQDRVYYLWTIIPTGDGGIALVGLIFLRTAGDFSILWRLRLEQGTNFSARGIKTADGGFAIGEWTGTDTDDFYLAKFSPDPALGIPLWSVLPDTTFAEDDSLAIDLPFFYDHLADANTPDSLLTITADSSERIFAEFNGEVLTLTSQPNWWGDDSIKLTVADPDSFSSSRYLRVMVTSVNDPPLPFTLLFPPDNSEATQLEMTFLWAEATQNPMETDSVQYRLFFRTQDYVYDLPLSADRFYYVNDIRDILRALHPSLQSPIAITWGVRAVDSEDSTVCERDFTLNVNLPQSVAKEVAPPLDFALTGVHPNPFNSATVIRYSLPHSDVTRLTIIGSTGREIFTISDGWQDAGEHEVLLEGSKLPAGVYLARLQFGGKMRYAKLVCVK